MSIVCGPKWPYYLCCNDIGLLGTGFMQVMYLGRAPRTKETLPHFLKWRRVTRHLFVFRGLTGSQRTPGLGHHMMYVMNCTRPDIAYADYKLSRYTSNPGPDHWKAIVRVLRYLKYTQNYGLQYSKYPAVLEGYCDANWISDTKDSKSTSGYLFILGGGAVPWKSSKQTCIARSTIESEFIAQDKVGEEA